MLFCVKIKLGMPKWQQFYNNDLTFVVLLYNFQSNTHCKLNQILTVLITLKSILKILFKVIKNYKVTWTSLLTNEKAKSTFTRRLLRPNRPPTWALIFKQLSIWGNNKFTYINLLSTCYIDFLIEHDKKKMSKPKLFI